MYDSSLEGLIINVLYLLLFFFIAVVFMVLYATERKMLARRIFSYSYIILGLIGAAFLARGAPFLIMAVLFEIIYVVMIALGIYMFRWEPKQKISLTN